MTEPVPGTLPAHLNLHRTRPDRCPGVLRPWKADDGLLVRIRLVGGRLEPAQLQALAEAAGRFGDGFVRPTNRANLQLRAFADDGTGHLLPEAEQAIVATGLVPSPRHDLVRNVMASPLTGIDGGRADVGPIAKALDEGILASDVLADLPGKFLFVLDDGRGDVLEHFCDLGLVALDGTTCQLRIGDGWGEVLPLADAPARLLELAELFVASRGGGDAAAWHVDEMGAPLVGLHQPDDRLPRVTGAVPFVEGEGWHHVRLGVDGLPGDELLAAAGGHPVRITPWYGMVVEEPESAGAPGVATTSLPGAGEGR